LLIDPIPSAPSYWIPTPVTVLLSVSVGSRKSIPSNG